MQESTSKSKLSLVREKVNFPRLFVATIVFFAAIYGLSELYKYIAISQTFPPIEIALATWLLIIGFIVDICLIVDTLLIILTGGSGKRNDFYG